MTWPLNTPWISLGILDCLYKGSSYQLIPQVMCCSVRCSFLVPRNLRLHWEVLTHAQRQSPLQHSLFWCLCVPAFSTFRCLEVWLPMEIGQCLSASVCTEPGCCLASRHTKWLQSRPTSWKVTLEQSRCSVLQAEVTQSMYRQEHSPDLSLSLVHSFEFGRVISRPVKTRIPSLLLDYRGGTSYHFSFSM